MRTTAASASLVLHILAMIVLFLIGYSLPPKPPAPGTFRRIIIDITAPPRPRPENGGGGDRSTQPARRGRAPERTIRRIWVPPMIPRVDTPALPVQVAMLETPEFNLSTPEIGDPLGRSKSGAGGRNGLLGIGDRPGDGIGDKNGPGVHGPPEGGRAKPRITRGPEVIYRPEPEYSEEARKVRFQGTVILSVEISADGLTSQIRVVRHAGLGLDEKAIEAVSQWRFRPAMSGGQPVAVPALVEVAFHML